MTGSVPNVRECAAKMIQRRSSEAPLRLAEPVLGAPDGLISLRRGGTVRALRLVGLQRFLDMSG